MNIINTYRANRNEKHSIPFDLPESIEVSVLVSGTNANNTTYTVIHKDTFYFAEAANELDAIEKYIDYLYGVVDMYEYEEAEEGYTFHHEGWASFGYSNIESIEDEYIVVEEN